MSEPEPELLVIAEKLRILPQTHTVCEEFLGTTPYEMETQVVEALKRVQTFANLFWPLISTRIKNSVFI